MNAITKLAHRLMLVAAGILMLAGVPSIDVAPTSNGSVSVDIKLTSYAHAHNRALHACGDEPVTGDIAAHSASHCSWWNWIIIGLALAAAIASAISAGLVIATASATAAAGTAVAAKTFLSLTGAQWGLIAAGFGGLAALNLLFRAVCNVNKNNICKK